MHRIMGGGGGGGNTVSIFLGRPLAGPLRPRRRGGTGLVTDAVERVEHRHVRRQALLRDHVADERDEVVVRQVVRARSQLRDLRAAAGSGEVWGNGTVEGGVCASFRTDKTACAVVDGGRGSARCVAVWSMSFGPAEAFSCDKNKRRELWWDEWEAHAP